MPYHSNLRIPSEKSERKKAAPLEQTPRGPAFPRIAPFWGGTPKKKAEKEGRLPARRTALQAGRSNAAGAAFPRIAPGVEARAPVCRAGHGTGIHAAKAVGLPCERLGIHAAKAVDGNARKSPFPPRTRPGESARQGRQPAGAGGTCAEKPLLPAPKAGEARPFRSRLGTHQEF